MFAPLLKGPDIPHYFGSAFDGAPAYESGRMVLVQLSTPCCLLALVV